MVEFLTGVPGSGKTYKAVYSLYSNFAKEKNKLKDSSYKIQDIEIAYTNINELDYSKFDNVLPLDWDIFYQALTTLHTAYKAKNTDTQLKELAKEMNLLHCLIVIDECHNYFDNQDKVLIWWLSYHRHLHHEVYLITQSLALVNSKYKSFSEFFYRAVPSSLKIFKHMKYTQFTNSRLSNNAKTGVIKLPINQDVFAVYGSGKNSSGKSVILKYLLLIALFLLGFYLILHFYMMGSSPTPEPIKDNLTINTQASNNNPFNETSNFNLAHNKKEKYLVSVRCSQKFNTCYFKKKIFSKKFLDSLAVYKKYDVVAVDKVGNTNYTDYLIYVDSDFYHFLNIEKNRGQRKIIQGVNNETNTFNNNLGSK